MSTHTHLSPIKDEKSPNQKSPAEPSPHPALSLFPPGQLTLLIGEPGIGKSLLAIHLAAHLANTPPSPNPNQNPHPSQSSVLLTPSSNSPLPPHSSLVIRPSSFPRPALYLSREDTSQTLHHRFRAARAHPRSYILLPTHLELHPHTHHPAPHTSLLHHLHSLLQQNILPSCLVLDPLPSVLGHFNNYVPTTIQKTLDPLLHFVRTHAITLVGINHLAKPTAKNNHPLSRVLGSKAYRALAPTILLATENPPSPLVPNHNPNPNLNQTPSVPILNPQHSPLPSPPSHLFPRLLLPLKSAAVPLNTAYPFRITSPSHIEFSPTPIHTHPLLAGSLPSPDFYPLPTPPEPNPTALFQPTPLDRAIHFLQSTLAHGPILSTTLQEKARHHHLSPRTLERARRTLRILTHYEGHNKKWYSSLPTPRSLPAPN